MSVNEPLPPVLEPWVWVDLRRQLAGLRVGREDRLLYVVSTALAGAGERLGSGGTPRGWHRIRACIGAGCPLGAVFVGRRPSGEVYETALAARFPERDWILTRILWLSGLEPGRNRFGSVDTQRRFIYFHATPDSEPMGVPRSHGCVRLRNADMLDLFERVRVGTRVWIGEGGPP